MDELASPSVSVRPAALVCGSISMWLEDLLSKFCVVEHCLADNVEVSLDQVERADLMILRSPHYISAETARATSRLRMVIRAGSGMEGLCAEALATRGVRVHRLNGAGPSVAEHGFGLLLSAARAIPRMQSALKAGHWLKKEAHGIELHGKTLLIVGLGQVGRHVARIAEGLGLRLLIADRSPSKPEKQAALDRLSSATCVSLAEGLAAADFVMLCCSLNSTTAGMIDQHALEQIKPGAILVNVARAQIVERDALQAALDSGRLAAAGLDVHYNEPIPDGDLLRDERIFATPHIGAQTVEARRRIEDEILALVTAFARRERCDA
jgi:D-3-phosphoglycerate dehydrogenase